MKYSYHFILLTLLLQYICLAPISSAVLENRSLTLDQSELSKTMTFLIEFKNPLSKEEQNSLVSTYKIKSLQLFDSLPSDYFKRLYQVEIEGNKKGVENILKTILKNPNVLKIEEQKLILNNQFSIRVTENNPSNGPIQLNDLLLPFEWAIFPNSQEISRDLDDIHLEKIITQKNSGIGIVSIYPELKSLMKNEVVVAVLDSGVDLDHPDLQENLKRNSSECENGKLPFKPQVDRDSNGYIGDCIGWNFVSSKKEGDEKPFDDLGHGTHIAGIIAATSNNSIGISGVTNSNLVKILPIKVLQKNEGGGSTSGTLSDRLAKGILYAIKRNVSVINLSLGWPLSADTEYLRKSIEEAIKRNIVIVAAAGNNNHASPIFPCAYEGVICVGATDASNSFSSFSNYGGQVDILAPGDNILSTIPMKLVPEYFSIKGYDLKNGTSQSAPFVSSLAAIFRSIDPSISNDEIYARIIAGSEPVNQEGERKFSLSGKVNFEKSLHLPKKLSPLIFPDFKELQEITIQKDNSFSFPLKIKNLGDLAADSVKIEVSLTSSTSQTVNLQSSNFLFFNVNSKDQKTFNLQGNIKSILQDNQYILNLDISIINKDSSITTNHFSHLVKMLLPFSSLQSEETFKFILQDETNINTIFGIIKDSDVRPLLSSIIDPKHLSAFPQFYLEEKTEKGINVKVFNVNKDQNLNSYKYATSKDLTLQIPEANSIIGVYFHDMNYDGEADFWITSIVKKEKEKFIQYSYFKSNGSPLFGSSINSHMRFIPENVILPYNKLAFLPYYSSNLKSYIASPIWIEENTTPYLDLRSNPFEEDQNKYDQSISNNHIYYLVPSESKEGILYFKTRIMDNFKFREELQKLLNLNFNDQIDLLELMPQSDVSFKKGGQFYGIISVGKNYLRKQYTIEFSYNEFFQNKLNRFKWKISPLKFVNKPEEVSLSGNQFYPSKTTLSTNSENPYSTFLGGVFIGHENNTTIMISDILNPNSVSSQIFRQENKKDHILSGIATFQVENQNYLFLQSKSNLILLSFEHGSKEAMTVASRPITRFSFLPGTLFQESFYPITITSELFEDGNSKNLLPALYVDSSEISRKEISILTTTNKGQSIITPIKYDLKIPSSCKALNPSTILDEKSNHHVWSYILMCEEKGTWSIHFIPLTSVSLNN